MDLLGLAQECCPDLDLKSELERSFLSEPLSPSHTKTNKGFRLGKHKHETFITRYTHTHFYHLQVHNVIVCDPHVNKDACVVLFLPAVVSQTTSSQLREPT